MIRDVSSRFRTATPAVNQIFEKTSALRRMEEVRFWLVDPVIRMQFEEL